MEIEIVIIIAGIGLAFVGTCLALIAYFATEVAGLRAEVRALSAVLLTRLPAPRAHHLGAARPAAPVEVVKPSPAAHGDTLPEGSAPDPQATPRRGELFERWSRAKSKDPAQRKREPRDRLQVLQQLPGPVPPPPAEMAVTDGAEPDDASAEGDQRPSGMFPAYSAPPSPSPSPPRGAS